MQLDASRPGKNELQSSGDKKMQGMSRGGEGGDRSLPLFDPEPTLLLGWREKRRAKIITGMEKKKMYDINALVCSAHS